MAGFEPTLPMLQGTHALTVEQPLFKDGRPTLLLHSHTRVTILSDVEAVVSFNVAILANLSTVFKTFF
jgi:hypothetical protein